jgi:hypothetical protein
LHNTIAKQPTSVLSAASILFAKKNNYFELSSQGLMSGLPYNLGIPALNNVVIGGLRDHPRCDISTFLSNVLVKGKFIRQRS